MKNIAIFHHVYQYGDWEKVYLDQVSELEKSGLLSAANYLFLGVNGNLPIPQTSRKENKLYQNKNNEPATEYYTQKALYDYCNLKDCYVLYLHTKGVSWTPNEQNKNNKIPSPTGYATISDIYVAKQKWRKYLEYFLIGKWKKCVDLLQNYDTVGTEWVDWCYVGGDSFNVSCYAGNFWWSKSEYIKKLDPNFILNNIIIERFSSEYWISTKNPRFYNFHTFSSEERNLYFEPIETNEYEGLS